MKAPIYTLRQGASGQQTRDLQLALAAHGYGLDCDGDYGKATAAVVCAFERANGLTVDGIAGPAVLHALGLPVPAFGVDVSHYQGTPNWPKVAAAGVGWACVKVANGTALDDHGQGNLEAAEAAGLPVDAYAYAKPDPSAGDPEREAVTAVHAAMPHLAQGAALVLDLEERGGLTGAQLATWAAAWIAKVKELTGSWPWIYCNADFILNVYSRGTAAERALFASCPLWLAQLTRDNDPSLPVNPIWDRVHALQFRWDGQIDGIAATVDCNWVWL